MESKGRRFKELNNMKNVFKKLIFAIAASALIVSCSQDENQTQSPTENAKQVKVSANRNAGELYPEFAVLFRDLYGSNYRVSRTTTEYRYEDRYLVTEVYTTVSGSEVLKGYFVEIPSENNVIYLDYFSATGYVNTYDFVVNRYVKEVVNLNLDPMYSTYGFTPHAPRDTTGRRFWGWETSYGAIGHSPNGGCFQGVYHTHYVCWIAGPTTPVLDDNGHPETITVACP
jgi:hypothetical protein